MGSHARKLEDHPCHTVPAFSPIELREDAAALRLVVHIIQQVQRLGHATQFAEEEPAVA